MKDRDHPFFRPLYRRILVTLFCAVWAAWEVYNGERMWAYITMGITAYAAWVYLITYDRDRDKTVAAADAPAARTDDEEPGPEAGPEAGKEKP
jgi:hypothetical protein